MSDPQDAADHAFQAALKEIERVRAAVETSISFDREDCRALATIPDSVRDIPGLTGISLSRTQVSNLAPLRDLTGLQTLTLGQTAVANLAPLRGLTELRMLSVSRTAVADLAPLRGLTRLQVLYLSRSAVADLAPLRDLTGLQSLFLDQTAVADLAPLQGLTGLQVLYLSQTAVADLAPLRGLTELRRLSLNQTAVADMRPICLLEQLGKPRIGSLTFFGTPAIRHDPDLARLSEIVDDTDRTRQTLDYLRSLPPWPEPLPWLRDSELFRPLGGGLPSANPSPAKDGPLPRGLKRLGLSDARHILEVGRPFIRDRCQFVVAAIDDALASHLMRIPNEPEALREHDAITDTMTLAKAAMVGIHEAVPEDFSDRPIGDIEAGRLQAAFNTALARLQQAAAYVDRKDHTPTYGGLLKLGAATAVGSVVAMAPGVTMAAAVPAIYACLYGPEAAKAVFAIFKGDST
jgi:hypothetical protein